MSAHTRQDCILCIFSIIITLIIIAVNDFYKGNRYRNAVVREDFPTALHEQIKETEQAQRQVEAYRRRLTEQ